MSDQHQTVANNGDSATMLPLEELLKSMRAMSTVRPPSMLLIDFSAYEFQWPQIKPCESTDAEPFRLRALHAFDVAYCPRYSFIPFADAPIYSPRKPQRLPKRGTVTAAVPLVIAITLTAAAVFLSR